jgi:hypothetical protein
MHGAKIKITDAQHARQYNIYKNTKLKLLKSNAAIWFNKMCRERHLRPRYINISINGRRQQDKKTTAHAVQFRINQEIKFLCKKKQHLNDQLHQSHLRCAHQFNGMWQHILDYINRQMHEIMETLYQKLNKKLDNLTAQTSNHGNKHNTNKFQSKIINLSNTHFSKE